MTDDSGAEGPQPGAILTTNAEIQHDEEFDNSQITTESASDVRRGRLRVALLGTSFLLLFSAYNGTQNLQTAVNGKLGYWSLACIYAPLSFFNPFTPLILNKISTKWATILSATTYVLYIGTNIRIIPALYFISSILLGVGACILWAAQGVLMSGYSTAETMAFNTSIFYGLHSLSNVFGNVASSIFFQIGLSTSTVFIILTCLAAGANGSFFLLSDVTSEDISKGGTLKNLLLATIVLFKDKRFLLMTPLGLFLSFHKCLFWATVPALIGKDYVGFIIACGGVVLSLGSFVGGPLINLMGRARVILLGGIFGILSQGLLAIVLLFGITKIWWFAALVLLQACTECLFEVLVMSTIGLLWPQRAAGFSAWRLFIFFFLTVWFMTAPWIPSWVLVVSAVITLLPGLFAFVYLANHIPSPNPQAHKKLIEMTPTHTETHSSSPAEPGTPTALPKQEQAPEPEPEQEPHPPTDTN
ncbi:Ion channel regulatory protein UNC-93 [Pelomyxa schiedti]|nr:Ion channel regulatory protein UNC-93 [Pelomyxa schiedti]